MLRQSRNGLYKNQSIYILHSLMSMMLFMAHIVVGLKVAAEFRLNRRSAEIKDLKKKKPQTLPPQVATMDAFYSFVFLADITVFYG